MILSMALMTMLTFLFVAGPRQRLRITVLAVTGIIGAIVALAIALSIEELRSMFEVRAALVQHYDVGATGRFGRIFRAIPELLDRPNGYGPMQFREVWFEDPHNVYLNAFSAYGWLGGLSYLCLIGATLVVGWRLIANTLGHAGLRHRRLVGSLRPDAPGLGHRYRPLAALLSAARADLGVVRPQRPAWRISGGWRSRGKPGRMTTRIEGSRIRDRHTVERSTKISRTEITEKAENTTIGGRTG